MLVTLLGGLGLFLLGMSVMTDGLRAMAGSALRSLLGSAAATPARGTLWGAIVTLIVQSSSATTMTTIGLVSAGLLTFPQAIGVVLGANIGTTGTGWLVALLGVRLSLTSAAMPLLFAGALVRLFAKGRLSGAGGALAGFALLLLGLTVLQQGMAGLAERIQPQDLPTVVGAGWLAASAGVAKLVIVGIIMTTVMQSSSAAVAATISALHVGAIGPDQAAALVIGQNIGTAVSTAIAAIGGTNAAKRTAVAHILFNILTGAVILALFPLLAPLLVRAASVVDGAILLATFHTADKLLGVAILLPLIGPFSRLVERLVPLREPGLARFLDPASLEVPGAAVEAARRTVAGALAAQCAALNMALTRPDALDRNFSQTMDDASESLHQTRIYLSELHDPPTSQRERDGLANVLHALDHAARLAERATDWAAEARSPTTLGDPEIIRAIELASGAIDRAHAVARAVATPRRANEAEPAAPYDDDAVAPIEAAHADRAGAYSRALADLRRQHRARVMVAAADRASGITAANAIDLAEAVRLLDKLAYHAWRGAAHLSGAAPPAA